MSNKTFRLFAEHLGNTQQSEFIGRPGEIFYDPETGVLKISDGETPGGHYVTESSPLESLFIGPWVYFVRPDNQPEVMDEISPNLVIARAQGGLIYNAVEDSDGYELITPYGTQWNTQGWEDFSDTTTRYYENLGYAMAGGGWALVKHNFIMHDTQNDKYYAIRFLTWDSGNNYATGAFSYIRREINTAIYFNREDTNDEATALVNGDVIDTGLTITRGNGQAIFNYGQGINDVWTQFNVSADAVSVTWNTNQTVTVVDPSSTMLEALNALKVGDNVSIDNGYGAPSSQTVTEVYNPLTGTFKLDYGPDPSVQSTFIYMNLPTVGPKETNYDEDQSPFGTLWNAEGYDNLANLKSRQWLLFDDLWAGNYIGKRITGKELVMWDTINDKYYAIKFTRWQQGNAGFDYPGFSYTRRQIDVEKLSSGIKFSDGTIQQTAYSEKIAGTLKQSPKLAATTSDRYITPGDIGRVIYLNAGTTTGTLRIGDGGTADFPVGATITIINRTNGTIYLVKENNDETGTIYGAGTSDQGTAWQIPDNGGGNIATLMKIEAGQDPNFNDWMLSGSNIVLDV